MKNQKASRIMNNVTAIIVSYNTPDLLKDCYTSLRRFYPTMPVIIIDGSPQGSGCWLYSRSIVGRRTTVKNTNRNIGHGPGMVMGIELCKTEHFLLVDSDVVINRGGVIEEMQRLLIGGEKYYNKNFIYGCGPLIFVDEKGGRSSMYKELENPYSYMHPHFSLIKIEAYKKNYPIIHHGAPMLSVMNSIRNKGFIFIPFHDLSLWITHHERGTRVQNPKHFHPKYWDDV